MYIHMLMKLNYLDISTRQDSLSLQDDINKFMHWTDDRLIKLSITNVRLYLRVEILIINIPITSMMFN